MLTPKQEAFCKNIVYNSMSYSDAYRNSYNVEKMTDKSINEKASLLKDNVKIRARIEELRAEIDTPRVMSAQKRAEKLSELADNDDPNVSMKAIDLLNKMTGEYIQKVVADVDTSYTINIELSDEEE